MRQRAPPTEALRMAHGVSENFLKVARREHRVNVRAAALAVLLAPLAAFLAELADAPRYGPVWELFLLAGAAGLVLGFVLTRRRLLRYEAGLRVHWNHWMHGAVHAARLRDVERTVHDQDPLPSVLGGALAVLLLAANVALFALLWVEHAAAGALAPALLGLDGVVLGWLLTSSALMAQWTRGFTRSAEDLVRRGELAIWGER